MKSSTIKASFKSDINKVWEIVTDNKNYNWRSDISKIDIINNETFIEYTNSGFPTKFIIRVKNPYERYEFDIKNKNMSGHLTGIFIKTQTGTKIKFTEEISVNNPLMNLFVKIYLNKQQKRYIADLKKSLGE